MRRNRLAGTVLPALLVLAPFHQQIRAQTLSGVDRAADPLVVQETLLSGLSWREIGPAMFAGRVADVAGVAGNRNILYVAAASSGLFKSTNGGITFEPVFEDGGTLSIGAIAVHPDDPDVVYVGTGEGAVRNSISIGDGLYRSTDGGATWTHLGLTDTERFSRIVIDPENPEILFAAAMGHAWGPNEERGLFRSSDGGDTWERVLYVNETTGASDVAIDPLNPDIVYAGMYDYLRRPWHFRSGGPGSGLFRSADGGNSWTRLTDPGLENGLPGTGVIGRVGVSVHAADPNRVYALIESREEGELWRSDDRGIAWQMVSAERRLNNRPFYYTQVRADPVDPDRVYTLAGQFSVSTDGGLTFGGHGGSMFGDHHALWIDPTDPARLLSGTDGGFWISNDFGGNWDFLNNMPMAQAYHLGLDMAEPYNVLGGFQDHEIWRGPNEKWNRVGVREGDWVRLRYMADGMYTVADPRDPEIIYYNGHFGDITRIDMRTREERYIQPYPPGPAGGGAELEEYRFNWNSPIHMSPSDPDVIYYGGNVLFRTRDGGENWDIISPDLTTDDPGKQRLSGGPISPDNTRAEYHSTILSISESALDPEVIWVGTDDGNVQITRDGGGTWTNVAPNIEETGAPANSWVASIQASRAVPGRAYVAIDQHRMDDFESYVFVTDDFGSTWRRISDGLRSYVHVVDEDLRSPNLLYAGTELGIFASFDGGNRWVDLRLGLPPVAVRDLEMHPRDNDLVIATHSRGFYILDDVTALQRLAAGGAPEAGGESAAEGVPEAEGGGLGRLELFDPMPAVRYTRAADVSTLGNRVWVAPNQPYGALLTYWVDPEWRPEGRVRVDVMDTDDRLVRSMTGPAEPGVNRVVWNLDERSACVPEGEDATPAAVAGGGGPGGRRRGGGTWVRAVPGTYSVRLRLDGETSERPVVVRMDPRVDASAADMDEWYRAAAMIERAECTVRDALARLRPLDARLQEVEQTSGDASIRAEAAAVRDALRPILLGFAGDVLDPGHVNLAGRLNWFTIQVGNYSGRPTAAQWEWIERYARQVADYSAMLEPILEGPVAELERKLGNGRE
ncbi:MAG: hypothetical protein OXN18_12580 [Gemmatimonadota bacterium]|nr:hypothetical protein [Gemmatimonadota bacterium]